jgi:hypothetical protein
LGFHPAFAGLNKTAAFPAERDFASLNNLYPALRGLCQLSNFYLLTSLTVFPVGISSGICRTQQDRRISRRAGFRFAQQPLPRIAGTLPTLQFLFTYILNGFSCWNFIRHLPDSTRPPHFPQSGISLRSTTFTPPCGDSANSPILPKNNFYINFILRPPFSPKGMALPNHFYPPKADYQLFNISFVQLSLKIGYNNKKNHFNSPFKLF